ncbi:MAG: 5-formyltetrahydrofolate cyclo-ligase [Pseudomonadota bacterium]
MAGAIDRLRQRALEARNALPANDCQRRSALVTETLNSILEREKHAVVALYCAVHNEVDVTALLTLSPNRHYGFPVIGSDKHLQFYRVRSTNDLQPDRFRIPAPRPAPENVLSPTNVAAIVVPVVAFDAACHRIGMGGGYYDRTLPEFDNAKIIGVAYETQRCDSIEPQPWDVAMHRIVTDQNVYERALSPS